jgi:Lar family restriction alleviation protein
MIELKPCPFCGESEQLDCGIYNGTLRGVDYVQCQNCGAEINALHINGKTITAADAWNRRADYGEIQSG